MNPLTPYLAAIRLVLESAFVIAILFMFLLIKHDGDEIKSLKQTNSELTTKTEQQTKDIILCKASNDTNNSTITALRADNDKARQVILDQAKLQQTSATKLTSVQQKLDQLSKVPANDGTLSNDLKETLRGLK